MIVCDNERMYTKQEVSKIVRDRVNKLNERIEQLELELSILKIERELKNNE